MSNRKAAIYVRVSTEEQAQDGFSVAAQIETLSQYCKLFDIEVYKVYKDLGVSGKTAENRNGLQRLLKDAESGLYNMVIVWKISRLTRSLKDLLNILDDFERYNVDFVSYSEKLDTATPVGRMTLQLLGSIAEFERNTIVENVKLGLNEFARSGGKAASVLGYNNINKELIINEHEAEIVNMIFRLYAHKKMGLSKIAAYLNENGYRTKRGNPFRSDGIGVILDNPVYIGINRHNIGEPDQFEIRGQHLPIIEGELWNKAQELRRTKRIYTAANKKNMALLTGMLFCPLCGSEMYVYYTKAKGKSYRYYKCCMTKSYYSSGACNGFSINADNIEAQVFKLVNKLLYCSTLQGDIIKHCSIKPSQMYDQMHNRISNLQKQIQQQNNILNKYFTLYENGKLENSELLLERVSLIDEHIKLLTLEKEQYDDSCTALEKDLNKDIVLERLRNFSITFNDLDKLGKRKLLVLLINRIAVQKNKKIEGFYLRFPVNNSLLFKTI